MTPQDVADDVWAYGSNDHVWEAIFEAPRSRYYPEHEDVDVTEVAAALLEKIERTPDFTVGDLNQKQAIAQIHRRFPILGPNPNFSC